MNKQTNLNDNKEVKEVEGEIPNKWRIFTHCSKLFQFQIVLKTVAQLLEIMYVKFIEKVWHQSLFLQNMLLSICFVIH